MTDLINDLTAKIHLTKKYQRLSLDVVEDAVAEASRRYTNPTEIDRKARNILHQIWGAYYYNPPNFKKVIAQYQQAISEDQLFQKALLPILELHSSTRERLPFLHEFYAKIFAITGKPANIVDHACGLNPLTRPWMNLPENCKYFAYDIDQLEVQFLNTMLLNYPNIQVAQASIRESSKTPTDIAFFFKCITCLDHLQKGIGLQALERQKCKYAVVSFAIKSIKGFEKGMKDFYSIRFEEYLQEKKWEYQKLLFPTEMVYVILKSEIR